MDIKIIGYNCSNGIKLKKNISKINEIDVNLELLEGDEYLDKYDIKNIPYNYDIEVYKKLALMDDISSIKHVINYYKDLNKETYIELAEIYKNIII